MALARDKNGYDHKCVAVIGDGALTGGMALEAINHAGTLPNTPFVVVLNDNDMSISPPVGALSTYLNKVRLSPLYSSYRIVFKKVLRIFQLLEKIFQKNLKQSKEVLED